MKSILVILFLISASFGEYLFYSGLGDTSFREYSSRYNSRVYQVWGRDRIMKMVDKAFVDYVRDYVGQSGDFVPTKDVVDILRGKGYGDAVIATPTVVEFRFFPTRRFRLAPRVYYEAILKIQYSFYDVASEREIYITEIVSRSVLKKELVAPWRRMEREVVLSSLERQSMVRELIDANINDSEIILKEVARIKKSSSL